MKELLYYFSLFFIEFNLKYIFIKCYLFLTYHNGFQIISCCVRVYTITIIDGQIDIFYRKSLVDFPRKMFIFLFCYLYRYVVEFVKSKDKTRPVTAALNKWYSIDRAVSNYNYYLSLCYELKYKFVV